jgi:virginiamycin B lyase
MKRVTVVCLLALGLAPASAAALGEPLAPYEQPPYFGHPLPGAHAFALASGPDGNLWFAGIRTGGSQLVIGRVTPNGEVTRYPRPSSARATSITAGPDGALWFTDGAASRVGRITPSGEITEFALPPGRHPGAITAGADGNLWFTERAGDRVGRITTSGRITEFPLPDRGVKPGAIVAGPDGALWFTQERVAKIGRITPEGVITQFGIPTETGAHAIVAGPEGKLWFAAGDQVGAISPGGEISWPACLLQGCPEPPAALGVGPEGALWVATGFQSCSRCGGGAAIELTLRPGGIGRYQLPPVKLGIGPRATPIRKGATSLLLACGRPRGCRGQLRLTQPEWRRRDRVLGKVSYSLAEGEARRVSVPLLPKALEEIREHSREPGDYPYFAHADAGRPGAIEARQRAIVLAFARPESVRQKRGR